MAQHDDAAAIFLPPQHLGCGKTRRATADDHDLAGRVDGALHPRLDLRLGLLPLFANEDAVAFQLDLPDRDRAECRRPGGFAGTQIETGVMPGTTDALPGHEAFRKRPVIMAAIRADRENLRARSHQHNLIIADMTEQCLTSEFGQGYAL